MLSVLVFETMVASVSQRIGSHARSGSVAVVGGRTLWQMAGEWVSWIQLRLGG